MLIDTHCHISNEFYDDINEVIEEDFKYVDKIIISGCEKDAIKDSINIATRYENIYVTIGYHPDQVDYVTDSDLLELKSLLKEEKVIGIGEIGLDYYWVKDNKEKQIELFEKQLKIAEELNLPVVVHSRDATEDTIKTLSKYKVRGIIHAFSGSVETAKKYISMGFLLGIGGVVTFKNSKLYQVIERIGVDNLVLETDSPYLTPHPHRGEKNSSKYIPLICERVAEVTGKTVDEVSKITGNNASKLFDLA